MVVVFHGNDRSVVYTPISHNSFNIQSHIYYHPQHIYGIHAFVQICSGPVEGSNRLIILAILVTLELGLNNT